MSGRGMRVALAAALLLAAGETFDSANADPHGWCVIYNGKPSGTECWFVSYEQCRATASGVGGFCIPNPRNAGITEPARRAKR